MVVRVQDVVDVVDAVVEACQSVVSGSEPCLRSIPSLLNDRLATYSVAAIMHAVSSANYKHAWWDFPTVPDKSRQSSISVTADFWFL